jgi:hypothetical protein
VRNILRARSIKLDGTAPSASSTLSRFSKESTILSESCPTPRHSWNRRISAAVARNNASLDSIASSSCRRGKIRPCAGWARALSPRLRLSLPKSLASSTVSPFSRTRLPPFAHRSRSPPRRAPASARRQAGRAQSGPRRGNSQPHRSHHRAGEARARPTRGGRPRAPARGRTRACSRRVAWSFAAGPGSHRRARKVA